MPNLEVGKTYSTKDGHTAVIVAELLGKVPGHPRIFLGYTTRFTEFTPMAWDATGHWYTSNPPKQGLSINLVTHAGQELWDNLTNADDRLTAKELVGAIGLNDRVRSAVIVALKRELPLTCPTLEDAASLVDYIHQEVLD
jgi:hypothetical protein